MKTLINFTVMHSRIMTSIITPKLVEIISLQQMQLWVLSVAVKIIDFKFLKVCFLRNEQIHTQKIKSLLQ